MDKSFDVFLSHNSKDKPAVLELAEALRARGLKVWLDKWELVPGQPWQEALEEVIETAGASVVLVGKDGLGPWQDAEMRGCLSEFVSRKLPVIPVLLPDAPEVPKLPLFLKRFTWVDLRGGLTEEGLARLQWGITGKPPDRSTSFPAPPEIERPAHQVLWSVPAWIALLILLGVAIFVLDRYFSRSDEPTLGTSATDPAKGLKVGGTNPPVPNKKSEAHNENSVSPKESRPPAPDPVPPCLPGKEREENGIIFVRICPGTFTMGSAENDPREEMPHQVTLSKFWIGKTEVTKAQYLRFRLKPEYRGELNLPANYVTWNEAKSACEHFGGRLPTEAEWEYAARAGKQSSWSIETDDRLADYAWYDKNSGYQLHEVATTPKANEWGLYDMHGNVQEWVADWYGPYKKSLKTDPIGPPTGAFHVLRGGGYGSMSWEVRSAFRNKGGPEVFDDFIGFRCAHGPFHEP